MTITDLGTLILAVATTVSLIYISRQLNVTRQQTKGQFLLALDAQFEASLHIMVRLLNEPNFTPVGEEWTQMWKLMGVYERIHIMVEDRILDAGIVDRLYGYQLILIIANDAIFDRLLATGGEWQDFIDLCYAIADDRERGANVVDVDKAFIERVRRLNRTARKLANPFGF